MLRGTSDLRGYFRTNRTPIYFISPTAFNLLGIDRWVRGFSFVNYFDSFAGAHPQVFVPHERPYREFTSIEDINNYLLSHKEVLDHVARRRARRCSSSSTSRPRSCARRSGLKIALPSAELRHRLDSKIVTTQLGNEAGVPSVPNRLGRAPQLRRAARARRRASATTSSSRRPTATPARPRSSSAASATSNAYAEDLVDEELKVMKRINCRAAAVEAVITRHGTVVGPVMRDLTGHPELTPYRGGWCGNDIYDGRAHARAARPRPRAHRAARRPPGGRGLPRLLRGRLPARRRHRRALPGRAQPAPERRDLDDQRQRRRLRRHAARAPAPGRVPRHRLRARRRRAQRALGAGRRPPTSGAS